MAGSLGTRLRERLLRHKRKLLGHVPQCALAWLRHCMYVQLATSHAARVCCTLSFMAGRYVSGWWMGSHSRSNHYHTHLIVLEEFPHEEQPPKSKEKGLHMYVRVCVSVYVCVGGGGGGGACVCILTLSAYASNLPGSQTL